MRWAELPLGNWPLSSRAMVKVGETMGSLMLSPAPKPCSECGFPAPSGPERSMTSPPWGEVCDLFAEFAHGFAGCRFDGDGFGSAFAGVFVGVSNGCLAHVSWFVLCC